MKRWLVILLITLAVIVLLSPGIIGRITEKNLDAGLARIDLDNEHIRIQSEAYTRGWFRSAGRHRIVLDGNAADLVGATESGRGPPALVIDTRLDHGLVPVTSMQRDRGSLNPGLASAISTLQIDRGDGELLMLPGRIYSFFGLDGNASFRFLLEPGSDRSGNVTTSWHGADIVYTESADGTRWTIDGTIEPGTVIDALDVATTIGAAKFAGQFDRSAHLLGDGDYTFALSSIAVDSPDAEAVSIGPVSLDVHQRVRDHRASGTVQASLAGTGVPGVGTVDSTFDIEFADLDADALAVLFDTLRAMNSLVTPQTTAELMASKTVLDRQMGLLLSRGGSIDIRQARISLPEGHMELSLDLDVAETADVVSEGNWATLALRSRASLKHRLSAGLFDHLSKNHPNWQAAVAGGFLVRRGDDYEIEADFENGTLAINGAPFPIDALLGVPRPMD